MRIKISLIILAGRNSENLKRLFSSISQLTRLPDEILVIYPSESVKIEFSSEIELKTKIKYIPFTGEGIQPKMRNIAIKYSNSDYLWYIDDDVSLIDDSCEKLSCTLIAIHSQNNVGAIGGRIIEEKGNWKISVSRPIAWMATKGAVGFFNISNEDFPIDLYEKVFTTNGKSFAIIPFTQGTNMVFRKEALQKVNGFDEDLGVGYASFEDSDPSFALKRLGYQTIYCGEFAVIHHKMKRIAGYSRSDFNENYNICLIRNFVITTIKNKYPSTFKSYYNTLIFCFTSSLRFTYQMSNRKMVYTPFYFIKSIYLVFKGAILGLNTIISSKNLRKNTV